MNPLRPAPLGRALALLLLALPAAAANSRLAAVRPGPVFSPVAAGWTKPLSLPLVGVAASGHAKDLSVLLKVDFKDSVQLRALSPIVHHLETSLGYTPEKFAALPEDQQRAAVQLAADEAVEDVRQKAYALIGESGNLVWGQALEKAQRAELFRVVAQLQELKAHYGPYLDEDGRELIDKSYAQSAARAYEIRQQLIEEVSGAAAKALPGASPASPSRSPPAAPVVVAAEPTSNAAKIVADMENNQQGWSSSDLDTVYRGYGFEKEMGGSHIKYKHPVFPQLYATVAHKRQMKASYIGDAVYLAREFERLRAEQLAKAELGKNPAPARPKPPAQVNLDELEVLLSPSQAAEAAEPAVEAAPLAAAAPAVEESPAPSGLLPADPERKPEAKPETPAPESVAEEKPQGAFTRWLERFRRRKPR